MNEKIMNRRMNVKVMYELLHATHDIVMIAIF